MFGKKFKKIRTELMLSQEQFGEFFGVTRQCIGYWEINKRDIPNHVLMSIQELCKGHTFTPILFLFDRCDKPFESRGLMDVIRYTILNSI